MSVGTADPCVSYKFPRGMRIIRSSDFEAVLKARGSNVFRVKSDYFTATCLKQPSVSGGLRFGITVGKKFARNATARVKVKRALRETARKQAPYLIALLCETGVGLDVSLRLTASLESFDSPYSGVHRSFRECLRKDIEKLFSQVLSRVELMQHCQQG